MRHESGNITHRLVGLFMAVIMPLCCCSTQVLGQVVLDDETSIVRAASCCGGSNEGVSDCDESTDTHDRCDCVRGHLGGNADTTTVMGSLATPCVAHPSVETTIAAIDIKSDLVEVLAAATGPPDDPGTPDGARRLRRIVILQN